MPRLKGTGKGESDRVNVRFDKDTLAYYRRKANEHGVTISEYLRQILVQGVIAENVQEIESRLMGVFSRFGENLARERSARIPDEIVMSILTTEQLLIAIVEAKDPQELYRAQVRAREKLKRIKEAENVEA